LAVAASVAAVGFGLSGLASRQLPSTDVTNDATRLVTPSAAAVELIEPVGTSGVAPARFRWKAQADAEEYRVYVFTQDGIPVWTAAPTRDTSLAPPAEVSLPPGRYLWHVSATRGGEPVARSKVGTFTIER
jgi:hypothetical protein